MRFFPLNLLLALGLFCLNALLGAIQYRHRGDLFAYGKFSFDPKPEQQFSGNFFQKTVNPAIYTALLCALFQRACILRRSAATGAVISGHLAAQRPPAIRWSF